MGCLIDNEESERSKFSCDNDGSQFRAFNKYQAVIQHITGIRSFNLHTNLRGRYSDCPDLAVEETGPGKLEHVPKVIQLGRGKAGTGALTVSQSPCF